MQLQPTPTHFTCTAVPKPLLNRPSDGLFLATTRSNHVATQPLTRLRTHFPESEFRVPTDLFVHRFVVQVSVVGWSVLQFHGGKWRVVEREKEEGKWRGGGWWWRKLKTAGLPLPWRMKPAAHSLRERVHVKNGREEVA